MDYYNDNKLLGRNLFWWKSLFITFDLIDCLLFKSTNVNKSLQFRAKTYQIIPLLGCKRGIIAEMRALRHITGPAPVYPQVNGAGLSPVISSTKDRSLELENAVKGWAQEASRIPARMDTAICWTRSVIVGTLAHLQSLSLLPVASVQHLWQKARMQTDKMSLNVWII